MGLCVAIDSGICLTNTEISIAAGCCELCVFQTAAFRIIPRFCGHIIHAKMGYESKARTEILAIFINSQQPAAPMNQMACFHGCLTQVVHEISHYGQYEYEILNICVARQVWLTRQWNGGWTGRL